MQNISLDPDQEEFYQGYPVLASYIKERKTCSFYEFLKLHRDNIVNSPPLSDDCEGLETAKKGALVGGWSIKSVRLSCRPK
ncbi:5090_t:CDS:2 [Funneliformis caledonium]|uniref:5090_t:CDS:1 n=1 Tax=Funneliformis caledonium TaxID=1117310 RepID=A0A9N9NS22_9GLOM|nr:5090_t:CDS:2 [Funneliformis caledonium]